MGKAPQPDRNYVFWVGVFLCTIYQSYRYPLQISNAGTSPTYSDTPLVLQAGKFVLAFPLMAISSVRWLGNSARLTRWPIALATLFLCCFSIIKIIDGRDSQYLNFSFWLLFSLILGLAVDSLTISAIDKYFCALLACAFGSTLIQVFLFVAFGRLPALAYEGTYLVRFGGFLDDPNGFAAIWFLLMGWSYHRFTGWNRFLILAGIVVCLLLTQSWTAIGFFVAMLFLFSLIWSLRRPIPAIFAVCIVPLFGIFVAQLISQLQKGLLWEALEAKQGSIEGHTFPWALWASKWTDWALLGEWKYTHYESWFAAAMINFGLVWVAVYIVLIAALLLCLRRASLNARPESKPVYAGLLLLGYYFAIGSFNLPFPLIFPINALFFLFAFLVAFGKIAENGRTIVPSRKLEPAGSLTKATPE